MRLARATPAEYKLQVPHEADFASEFGRRRRHFHRMLHSADTYHATSARELAQLTPAELETSNGSRNTLEYVEASKASSAPLKEESEDYPDQIDVSSAEGTLGCASDEEVTQERSGMRHFRSIAIKQDSSLYDATTMGNVEYVGELIRRGVEVDSNPGPLGTTLVPAILSRSPILVRLLLDAQANPIIGNEDGRNPLSLAACYGSPQIFDYVLQAALPGLSKRPQEFQRAVDRALFDVDICGTFDRIPSLLLPGANPVAQMGVQNTSAFEVVLGHSQVSANLDIPLQIMFKGRRI